MAMTRGKKRPMSPVPCLLLAAASCFAQLSECLLFYILFYLWFVSRRAELLGSHFFLASDAPQGEKG